MRCLAAAALGEAFDRDGEFETGRARLLIGSWRVAAIVQPQRGVGVGVARRLALIAAAGKDERRQAGVQLIENRFERRHGAGASSTTSTHAATSLRSVISITD